MTEEQEKPAIDAPAETPSDPRPAFEDLPPAAQRALIEAKERREKAEQENEPLPKEYNGRGGLEPTRYDDWEIKGMTSDF